jgi:cytoskeleton protein RodZ
VNGVEESGNQPQQNAWEPAAAAMPLPGATLAAARVAQGLSLEDIARQLKLSVAQIKSIEADDHSRLPSPVFVRGFIRTYARVLKLDIAQVQPPKVTVPDIPDVRLMQDAPRLSIEPNPYRRVPAILAVVVCVMLALAYYEFVLNAPPAPVDVVKPAAPAAPVPPAAPVAAAAETAAPAGGAATDIPADAAKPGAPGEPLALKKSADPVNEAVRGLRFVFNGQSWVEVRDGEGKVVFSRNNAPGTERRVNGEPPFSVVVGGASNVELTYNGNRVDLASFATDDVARLQLE